MMAKVLERLSFAMLKVVSVPGHAVICCRSPTILDELGGVRVEIDPNCFLPRPLWPPVCGIHGHGHIGLSKAQAHPFVPYRSSHQAPFGLVRAMKTSFASGVASARKSSTRPASADRPQPSTGCAGDHDGLDAHRRSSRSAP